MSNKDVFISVRSEEDRQKLLKAGFVEIKSSNGLFTFINDSHKWNFDENGVRVVRHNSLAI